MNNKKIPAASTSGIYRVQASTPPPLTQLSQRISPNKTKLRVDFDVNFLLKRVYLDWCLRDKLSSPVEYVSNVLVTTEAAVILVRKIKIDSESYAVYRLLIDSDNIQKIPKNSHSIVYTVRKENKQLISEVLTTSCYIEVD